jgi:hypothetical protein
MLVKPNETIIEGRVLRLRRVEQGHGVEVDIDVRQNWSDSADKDFLKPTPGQVVSLFSPEAPALKEGGTYRIKARLLAGPFGGRTILVAANEVSG